MRFPVSTIAVLIAVAVASDAQPQGLTLFPASQYGKTTLNLPQSTGGMSSVQLQNVLGRNANFERLDTYREQDRFRRIATPVGRLDLLVNGPMGAGVANCTASIISPRHIITNNHCFPEGQGAVKQASLLMDFYSEDNEAQAKRFEVKTVPVERNADLDFVIAEVSGNPSAQFGRIMLEPRDPEPGESLLIVHHPMGMPKHMTRGGCRAHAPVAVQGTDIRHRCDTLPGSSGSPILSEGTGRMLGLHYGGSPNPGPNTWNFGKRLSEISSKSRVLSAAFAEQRQQEEQVTRAAASTAASERAELERRVRDAEAAAKIEVDRLKAQLENERARVAALPSPAPVPRAETPADWAAAEVALGLTPDRIREVQQSLRAAGHDPRGIDGNLGQGTRGAIRSWQRARGVAETGYLSAEMLRLLQEGSAPAVAAVRPPAPATPPSPAQPAVGIWPAPPREAPRNFRGGSSAIFRDCPRCPEMITLSAGGVGVPSGGSIPIPHKFSISRNEVSFSEWDFCVESGGCDHRPNDMGWGRELMPVINVSWEDINSYLKWISGKSGKIYRLPSEVEWEYGAQGGGGVEQSMQIPGTASPQSCIGCGGRWDGKQPAPVGSFSPNLAGLYDMLGNVSEWVADCWNDSPISLSLGAAKRETGDCTRRVIKGGSWFLDASQARSSYRSKMSGRSRSATIGFRIIREE